MTLGQTQKDIQVTLAPAQARSTLAERSRLQGGFSFSTGGGTMGKAKQVEVQDRSRGSKHHQDKMKRYEELHRQIRRDIAEIGARFYSLGCAWKLVRDDRLWHAAGFKSFQAYVEGEIHMGGKGPTRMTVYNCLSVAECMTREQAVRLGPSLAYAVAKETEKVQAECHQLVSQGVSTTEVMRGLRERKAAEKAEKSKTQEEAAKRGLTVINGGGDVERAEAPAKVVKKAAAKAEERRQAAKVRDVEKGTVRLESTDKRKSKAGWTKQAVIEVGGLTVTVEVNNKKGLLRYTTKS